MRCVTLFVWCASLILISPSALGFLVSSSLPQSQVAPTDKPSVAGTWSGESVCVGPRGACKDEKVVYRFETTPDKPGVFKLLADKIIDNERVPMYQLDFQYDEANKTLSSEFRRGNTHGIWKYTINGNTMEGTVVILPQESVGRHVKVKRASEKDLPAAPARELYN